MLKATREQSLPALLIARVLIARVLIAPVVVPAMREAK